MNKFTPLPGFLHALRIEVFGLCMCVRRVCGIGWADHPPSVLGFAYRAFHALPSNLICADPCAPRGHRPPLRRSPCPSLCVPSLLHVPGSRVLAVLPSFPPVSCSVFVGPIDVPDSVCNRVFPLHGPPWLLGRLYASVGPACTMTASNLPPLMKCLGICFFRCPPCRLLCCAIVAFHTLLCSCGPCIPNFHCGISHWSAAPRPGHNSCQHLDMEGHFLFMFR